MSWPLCQATRSPPARAPAGPWLPLHWTTRSPKAHSFHAEQDPGNCLLNEGLSQQNGSPVLGKERRRQESTLAQTEFSR